MDSDVSKLLDKFFIQTKKQSYKRHQILINGSEEPEGLFYLKEGVVRQYAITPNGTELTINIFKPVSMFPLAWVFNDSIGPHYFETLSDATVYVSPKEEAKQFVSGNSPVMLDLVKRIYRGLDGYFLRMEHLMNGSANARLLTEILILAKRFGEPVGNKIKINIKLTERELAAQAGITRETVSREIANLKEIGLINYEKGTLYIKDLKKLEARLEEN